MIINDDELAATLARFRGLIADWRLTSADVAALLKVDEEALGLELVPRTIDRHSETRIRLVLDIAGMLGPVIGHSEPWRWVRARDLQLDDQRMTALQLLAGDLPSLRALRSLLHCYA